MTFMMGVFVIIIVGIVAGSATEMVKAWTGRRRGLASSEVDEIKRQLRDQAAALDEAHAMIGTQAERLEELSERLDFAERLMAKPRERPELGSGKQGPG